MEKQVQNEVESSIEANLVEKLGVELSTAEIDQVSGGRWIDYTDNGSSCDGPVWVY